MENSSRFFANTSCKYYPCHKGVEALNCLFCFCPLYFLERCPGKPKYVEKDGKTIKSCIDCSWPHVAENYDKVKAIVKRNL